MADKPTIPDFPTLPDFGQMITQACEVVASVRGIPYDFNGTLSLENKFVVLFKTVKEMFDAQDNLVKSYKALYDFINQYFNNLNLQDEVNKKIKEMKDNGELLDLVKPTVTSETTAWLTANITNPSNPPIDKSLTVENAAADAKSTGDKFKSLKEDLVELDNRLSTTNATINIFNKINVSSRENIDVSNGKTRFDAAWSVSEYINVGSNNIFSIIGKHYQNQNIVCFYDESKNFISGLTIDYPSVFNGESIPSGTKYIRFNIRTYQDYNDLNNVMFMFAPFKEPYLDTDYVPFNGSSNIQITDIIDRQTMPKLELLVLGDSYSANTDGWLLELSKIIDFSVINNYAVSGATLKDKYADRNTYPYSINPKLSDGSGNFNTISSQVEQISHEIATGTSYNNPDLIIIQGGTNDYPDISIDNYESQFWIRKENVYIKSSFADNNSTASLGTYFDVTKLDDTDRTTFAGAMHYIYSKLHEFFPNAKFIFISPSGLSYGIGNNIEYIKKTEQMRLCCEYLCQPLVEWARVGRLTYVDRTIVGDGSSENPYIAQNGGAYTGDGLHPKNGYPCKLLALPVASEIRKCFAREILLN